MDVVTTVIAKTRKWTLHFYYRVVTKSEVKSSIGSTKERKVSEILINIRKNHLNKYRKTDK